MKGSQHLEWLCMTKRKHVTLRINLFTLRRKCEGATSIYIYRKGTESLGFCNQADWGRYFSPDNMLIIGEIQMKTTMRFHLIPLMMAIIKKSKDRCW